MSQPEVKRLLHVVSAAILSIAAAGVLWGTRPPETHQRSMSSQAEKDALRARSYSELRNERRGANATMYDTAFAWLNGLGPSVTDPVEPTDEDRARAIEERRERRAYAGAPPVVPHPIQERNPAACLACHATGSLVGDLRAPKMSHKPYSMCVQCHAPQRQEAQMVTALGNVGEENLFEGLREAGKGPTAWAGAPPTIPHPTFMREDCSSCHGTGGALGLRTSHPVRSNCTQCHAASAPFDQGAPPALLPSREGSTKHE